MVQLTIKHDLKRLRKQMRTLPKKQITPITNRALNHAGKKVVTKAVKNIAKKSGIKPQRKVRDRIRLTKSNFHTLRVVVSVSKKVINLIEFVTPAKRKVGAFRKKKGVTAKAWGKKPEYNSTFIGRGRNSGKALVLARDGDTGKVKAIHGPIVSNLFINKAINRLLRTAGRKEFLKEWRRLAGTAIHKHLNKGRKKI